ncbi:MAG: BrnA antitoxin family protein [Rhizobiaceae bacterium]|nr:BrnA antitoxin family protein [Rhizobiaceae bacterium]
MAGPTRRPSDPLKAAESLFKPVPRGPAPDPRAPIVAAARETVSLRIDRDVLDHFQADGPGWQDRINAALRAAAGLDRSGDSGKRPEDLNATNDD